MQIIYKDAKFQNYTISKLIKCLTKCGLSETFEIYFYILLKIFKNKFKISNSIFLFLELIEITRPIIGLKRLSTIKKNKNFQIQ